MFYSAISEQSLILDRLALEIVSCIQNRGLQIVLSNLTPEEIVKKSFLFLYTDDFSVMDFTHMRQYFALYEKNPSVDVGHDKRSATLLNFQEDVSHVRSVNADFQAWGKTLFNPERERAMKHVAREFYSILRNGFGVNLNQIPALCELEGRFGPGSTTTVSGNCSPRVKLQNRVGSTPELAKEVLHVLRRGDEFYRSWLVRGKTRRSSKVKFYSVSNKGKASLRFDFRKRGKFNIVQCLDDTRIILDYSSLRFVEKDALVDRTIDLPTTLNGFLQKPIGRLLKRCLVRSNNDISKLQLLHKEKARVGSIYGDDATIDIKSASNSISLDFVLVLFEYLMVAYPHSAVNLARLKDLLLLTRSPYSFLETKNWSDETTSALPECFTPYGKDRYIIENPWLSSMGCAWTFEMETILFLSIARAACKNSKRVASVTVYGDDIIVPSNYFDRTVNYLSLFGFRTNDKKSFGSGPFRESCGGDYLLGSFVRPFYFKGPLTTARLVAFHNFLLESNIASSVRDTVWDICYTELSFTLVGPPGYGDGHLVSANESLYVQKAKPIVNGFVFGVESNHCLTVVKQPDADDRPLKVGDKVFPYYHASTYIDRTDDRSRLDITEDFSHADPYVISGSECEAITTLHLHGHSNDWFIVQSIVLSIAHASARQPYIKGLLNVLNNITTLKASNYYTQ
jgi:hypothetical protein